MPIIGPLPAIINPGDFVAAGPVMADFNWIVSQVNANGGGGTTPGVFVNPLSFGAVGDGVTDNTTPIQNAINAATGQGGGTVLFPPGNFLYQGGLSLSDNVTFQGCSQGPFRKFRELTTDPAQTQFSINYQGGPFITTTGVDTAVQDILFYYPNQAALTAAAPIVYPPTIDVAFLGFNCSRCSFVNSYDALNIRRGGIFIDRCLIGAFHIPINVDNCGADLNINATSTGPLWDQFAHVAYPQPIDLWVLANGTGIAVQRADAFHFSNLSIFSYGTGISFTDSVTSTPKNAYGTMVNIDIDTVVVGILAKSTRRLFGGQGIFGGVNLTNFNIVRNTLGASNVGFYLPAGGSDPPYLTVMNGNVSDNFTNGFYSISNGELRCTNVFGIDRPSQTVASPPVPASNTYTTTRYPYPVTIYISGGTYTNVAINGPVSGFATGGPQSTIVLPPNSDISITYTVAPTWVWFR